MSAFVEAKQAFNTNNGTKFTASECSLFASRRVSSTFMLNSWHCHYVLRMAVHIVTQSACWTSSLSLQLVVPIAGLIPDVY